MIQEPYIKIKTLDYSALSDSLPDSLNTGMVINSDTGPTALTRIKNVTDLIKYYSTKQQLTLGDDTTLKHAAKLLQFTPIYLTRAFDNSVLCGLTDKGNKVYTDLSYNLLPYSLKIGVDFSDASKDITFSCDKVTTGGSIPLSDKSVECMVFKAFDGIIERGYGVFSVPITRSSKYVVDNKGNNIIVLTRNTEVSIESIETEGNQTIINTTSSDNQGQIIYTLYRKGSEIQSDSKYEEFSVEIPIGVRKVNLNLTGVTAIISAVVENPVNSQDIISVVSTEVVDGNASINISSVITESGYILKGLYTTGTVSDGSSQADDDPSDSSDSGTSSISNPFLIDKMGGYYRVIGDNNLKLDNFNYGDLSNSHVNSVWSKLCWETSFNDKVEMENYVCLNGYTFYPSIGESSNIVYPNISVQIDFNNTYPSKEEFIIALLDKLISGSYGTTQAYAFTNGVKIDDTSVKVLKGNNYIVTKGDNSVVVYPNSINYNSVSKDDGIVIDYIKNNVHKIYTLPYNPSLDTSVYSTLNNVELEIVDTSSMCSIYGILSNLNIEYGISLLTNTEVDTCIYLLSSECTSYNTNSTNIFKSKLLSSSNIIQTLVPTQESLGITDSIGSCWIRLGNYVFYNINVTDRNIRNNPDLELIKLSSIELTYKQFIHKLRKEVGNVYNTINDPSNGFTIFWRTEPDATEFAYDTKNLKVTFNGVEGIKGDIIKHKVSSIQGNFDNDAILNEIKDAASSTSYDIPPKIVVEGDGFGAKLVPILDSTGKISSITAVSKGQNYNTASVTILPKVPIVNNTPIIQSDGLAVIARFPSKSDILKFDYIRQDLESDGGDPELYTFNLKYKGEDYGSFTISMVENKVDGYNRSVYYNWINDIQDFVQLIKLNGTIVSKEFISADFGSEVPVTEPEPDDYVDAANRFKTKDGTYYDFIFDGGYVNAVYAKALLEMCKGGEEDSLWAMAMLSPIDDKDWQDRISYRDATAINNCNAQMFGDWVQDSTVADFLVDISPAAIAIEKIYANRTGGREFACIFGPANGSMIYKPKYPIIDKDIRTKLLNKQIPTLIYDKSLGVSYFNLDLTLQTVDSSLSDCNNVRTINCMSHIADNYMKWFWGRVNDVSTRAEVVNGLTNRINERCVNNQIYHVDDFIVICNETNNPDTVIENRQLVVDIKMKFRPGVRYINVFHKVYRLTQDYNSVG